MKFISDQFPEFIIFAKKEFDWWQEKLKLFFKKSYYSISSRDCLLSFYEHLSQCIKVNTEENEQISHVSMNLLFLIIKNVFVFLIFLFFLVYLFIF